MTAWLSSAIGAVFRAFFCLGSVAIALLIGLAKPVAFAQAPSRPLPVEVVPNVTQEGFGFSPLAFSPDGTLLVATSNSAITIRDGQQGRLLRQLRVRSSSANQLGINPVFNPVFLAFSPVENSILASANGKLQLWSPATGEPIQELIDERYPFNGSLSGSFSGDGSHFVLTDTSEIRLWDVNSGKVVGTFRDVGASEYTWTAISNDGRFVYARSKSDKSIRKWDVVTNQIVWVLPGRNEDIDHSISMSVDRSFLATLSATSLEVFDLTTGEKVSSIDSDRNFLRAYLSPDGLSVAVLLTGVFSVKLFDRKSGREFATVCERTGQIAWAPNGERIACSARDDSIRITDPTHPEVSLSPNQVSATRLISYAPTGKGLLIAAESWPKLWDAQTGQVTSTRPFLGAKDPVVYAISPDGRVVATRDRSGLMVVWNAETGAQFATLSEGRNNCSFSFSSTAPLLLFNCGETVFLLEIATRKRIPLALPPLAPIHSGLPPVAAFSPDGKTVVVATQEGQVILFASDTGKRLKTIKLTNPIFGTDPNKPKGRYLNKQKDRNPFGDNFFVITGEPSFSKDGKTVLICSASWIAVVDLDQGKTVRTILGSTLVAKYRGQKIISASIEGTVTVFNGVSGDRLYSFEAHQGPITSIALDGENGSIATGGSDHAVKVWNIGESGQQLIATVLLSRGGDWVTMTPAGYFVSEGAGSVLLTIVRGVSVYSVDQFFQQLARQDLVYERLRGDPEGLYADAAAKVNLTDILNSGDPPQLTLLKDQTERAADGTVRVKIRIVDAGGGVGSKIIWKVNGVSQGDNQTPKLGDEGFVVMTNTLQIDPSKKNDVEVVAFNREASRASDTLRFKFDSDGASEFGAPTLYVLAIGVNKYAMPSYRLNFPEDDARNIAEKLTASGKALFGEANVVSQVLVAGQVTEKQISEAFDGLKTKIKPPDVFVLFLSGHGESRVGQYYYIPQDFDISLGHTWDKSWIGQDKWEKWLNGITANKQLLILDTCEAGAALGLVRGGQPERAAAMDQLRYATGKNIIAAASGEAKEATELGHGILTYTVLQALQKSSDRPTDAPGLVTVFGLAAFANINVPQIRQRIWNEPIPPISRLTKNDFGVGYQVDGNIAPPAPPLPTVQYVIMRDEFARSSPNGAVNRPVDRGSMVSVEKFEADWALISKDGSRWGLVPADALLQLH